MATNKIPFCLDPLDRNLVLAKPKHSISQRDIDVLEKKERLIATRKRDGHRHSIVVSGNGSSDVRIYTRTMNEATEKFPHLAKLVYSVGIPSGTVLDTELVCEKRKGADDFDQVARLARNSRAVDIQREEGFARLIILNPVVYKNILLTKVPFITRYHDVLELFVRHNGLYEYTEPIEKLNMSFSDAAELVRFYSWEGLVLYDVTKGTAFNLDGKHDSPPRPVGCWKWKPYFEEDFVATHFVYGKGRNSERMGKMYISQRDPQSGKLFSCGEVGVGFSDDQREHYASKELYPLVVEVKYERRFTSMSLRFPVFLRERADKTVDECYRTQ